MNLPVTPYARIATAAVATEKKLILLGGNVRDGSGITHDAARAELSRSMAAGVTVFNYTDYATHHTPLLCGPRFTVDRTNVTGQTCNVYSKTGLVYCFGGTRLCEEEDLLTGISILNPETSTWVNDLPVDVPRRWGHASTVVGDHLYIFGGETVNKRMLHDFWCISLRTNVPTALGFRQLYARSPPARQYACFIPISDEHLLLYGGFGDTSVLGDAWVYDIKFDTWKEATSWFAGTLPSARAGMTCTLSEGKVLMFGGVDQNQQLLSDFWVLDPLKWTWTMEHAVPGLRAEKREVGISVVGDTAATANPGETQLDVPYPSARAHHSAASVGKYLVITGGATSYNDTLREFYATDRRIYIFNVKTSQWVSDTQQLSGFEVEMDLVRVEASSHKWPIIVGGVGAAVVLLSVLLVTFQLCYRRRRRLRRELERDVSRGEGSYEKRQTQAVESLTVHMGLPAYRPSMDDGAVFDVNAADYDSAVPLPPPTDARLFLGAVGGDAPVVTEPPPTWSAGKEDLSYELKRVRGRESIFRKSTTNGMRSWTPQIQ